MLTFLLAALFCVIGLLTAVSLADSAVRWRYAWQSLQREMIGQAGQGAIGQHADVVAFHNVRPLHHAAMRYAPANSNSRIDLAA